jgi:hypothetical protein
MSKECKQCKIEKNIEEFRLPSGRKNRRTECRECENSNKIENRLKLKKEVISNPTKTKCCIKCDIFKPVTEFGIGINYCFPCHRIHYYCKFDSHLMKSKCNYCINNELHPKETLEILPKQVITEKICKTCKVTKDIDEFNLVSKNKPYYRGDCKLCCTNSSKCEHGLQKHHCKVCGDYCEHLKIKVCCSECRKCSHDERKDRCKICNPNCKYYCQGCGLYKGMVLKTKFLCMYCSPSKSKMFKTKEMNLKKFLELHYKFDYNKVSNKDPKKQKYFPDFVLKAGKQEPFNIIIECDENGHLDSYRYPNECEIVRQNNISDDFKISCVFIRFNPDSCKEFKEISIEEKYQQLKQKIDELLELDYADPQTIFMFYPEKAKYL